MADREQVLDTALDLSRRALEMLDAIGETGPAIHLQRAIDVMTGAPLPRSIEEAEALLDMPEARAILEGLSDRR